MEKITKECEEFYYKTDTFSTSFSDDLSKKFGLNAEKISLLSTLISESVITEKLSVCPIIYVRFSGQSYKVK